MVRHSGSAVILAVDDSGPEPLVLLERQYRYAADDSLWELPAGRIDPGEKALPGAKRELLEETGYRASKWTKALFFYPSPGFLDETMTVFLARGLTAGDAQPEEDESIECHLTPLSRALAMVRSGEIRDGKTIAAVLWLADSLRRAISDAGLRHRHEFAGLWWQHASKTPLEMGFWSVYSLDNTTKRGAKFNHAVQQANPTGQM